MEGPAKFAVTPGPPPVPRKVTCSSFAGDPCAAVTAVIGSDILVMESRRANDAITHGRIGLTCWFDAVAYYSTILRNRFAARDVSGRAHAFTTTSSGVPVRGTSL